MPSSALRDRLCFPAERVLLARTRLAYVHLGNLLSDAKRDRAARVFGYIAIWLPDEVILLYLQEGEVTNATATADGEHWRVVPIAEAVARVPAAAEYGSICFHTADDEQLAAMFQSQVDPPLEMPSALRLGDPSALLAYVSASLLDGVLDLLVDGQQQHFIFRDGLPVRGFLTGLPRGADLTARLTALLAEPSPARRIRLFPVPPPLPNQAPAGLVAAFRDLAAALADRLTAEEGADVRPCMERTREALVPSTPALERFSLVTRNPRDPTCGVADLSAAMGIWFQAVFAGCAPTCDPELVLRDLTRSRRYLFQTAGLFNALPWTMRW